jgi:hypothetical protein
MSMDTPDPAVLAALSLGWEMSDLYAAPASGPAPEAPPELLPGVEELSPRERSRVSLAKAEALMERALGGATEGISGAGLRELGDQDLSAWRRGVFGLHLELVRALEARDAVLSGAYDLGRSLADVSREPRDLSALMSRLEPEQLLAIEARLADLRSRLPTHAAAAVAATLDQWKAWTADARAREDMQAVRGALARQRSLWRSLLTGEKEARQMLDPDTVVAASVRHATRLGTLIRGVTGAYLPALAALALSVALLLWTIITQSGIAAVIGALGVLAATMIGIRKSLDLTTQGTIDELRGELWSAELDAAVAQAILRLPPAPPPAPKPRLSLARPAPPAPAAQQAPAPAQAEPSLRATVGQRIERALHVTTSARKQGFRVPASGPAAAPASEPAPETAETEAQSSANGHQASDGGR